MSTLSAHVLDTTLGLPAKDLTVRLEHCDHGAWRVLASAVTNEQGRCRFEQTLAAGRYRLSFDTAPYLRSTHAQAEPFYPEVDVLFHIAGSDEHYHIPLLLSPFGYSTYRGS